jgi:hypothetical protein
MVELLEGTLRNTPPRNLSGGVDQFAFPINDFDFSTAQIAVARGDR